MGTPRLLIAPLAVLAFAQGPETLTPEGPATLYDDWHGAATAEGVSPRLLTGFRVTVQPGGRAGTVRFLVQERPFFTQEGTRAVHAGAPVTLPAEPGTYVFPAPHVLADYRDVIYGIEQQTGGHAIAVQTRCEPEEGESDICNDQSVDVYQPPIGEALPDRRTAADIQRGRRLTIDPITEPDADQDGAGDETEDRTNLRTTAKTTKLSGGRRAFDVTVENAGPRTADLPRIQVSLSPSPGLGTWSANCEATKVSLPQGQVNGDAQYCRAKPLAVGERRTVRLVVPDGGRGDAYVTASAEGPDLAGGDEYADADFRDKRPPLTLDVDAYPRFEGFRMAIDVRSERKGTVRLTLQRGERTWLRRTITFRRAGERDVVLRIPRNFFRADGVATLTARSQGATVKARFEPSY